MEDRIHPCGSGRSDHGDGRDGLADRPTKRDVRYASSDDGGGGRRCGAHERGGGDHLDGRPCGRDGRDAASGGGGG